MGGNLIEHIMGFSSVISFPFIIYIAFQTGRTVQNIKDLNKRITTLEQMHFKDIYKE